MNELNDETRDRMEDLVGRGYLREYRYGVEGVIDLLYNEGFEMKDIKTFLIEHLEEILEMFGPTE